MGNPRPVTVNDALLQQFDAVLDRLRETIEMMPEDDWNTGDSRRHTPVRQAVHILGAFESYADRFVGVQFSWTERWGCAVGGFGRKIPVDELPDRAPVVEYLDEVRQKVHRWLGELSAEQLSKPRRSARGRFNSELGRVLYILRHGVLHLGYLNEELHRRGIRFATFR